MSDGIHYFNCMMNLAQRGFELTDVSRLNNFIKSSSQNSLLERTMIVVLILPVIIILPPLSVPSNNLHSILLRLVLTLLLHLRGRNSSLSVATDLDNNVFWLDTLGLREWVG